MWLLQLVDIFCHKKESKLLKKFSFFQSIDPLSILLFQNTDYKNLKQQFTRYWLTSTFFKFIFRNQTITICAISWV